MRMATDVRYKVKGIVFGMRGCGDGCSCDPCDCDPCTCGDGLRTNPPRWRVSGYSIRKGEIQGCDISGLVILSLSLPIQDGTSLHWREVVLIDSRANDEQVKVLLKAFEDELASMPVEINAHESGPRAVYRVPLHYHWQERPTLFVICSPETLQAVRPAIKPVPPFSWNYNGPMALRKFF